MNNNLKSKPTVLMILDGYGIGLNNNKNGIFMAKTPTMDLLMSGKYPVSKLHASGKYVGLPEGQIGNSEVGHLNIGAGRIIYTGLSLINKSIETGEFQQKKPILNAIEYAKKNNSKLHIMGLLSPGGVHSHEDHIFELIKIANKQNVEPIIHIFTDGRDVPADSAIKSIIKIKEFIVDHPAKLATIAGRFYAMDRDKRWERIQLAYDNIMGDGENKFDDLEKYVLDSYQKNILDEFFIPAYNSKEKNIFLEDNDAVIFANFRPDRARELSHCIFGSNYYDYEVKRRKNLYFVTMMKYEKINQSEIIFPSEKYINTLGQVFEKNHIKQLRISETEKYAHVTFFFDGGEEVIYQNEDKILIDSPKVATYDLKPEMSAELVINKLIEVIDQYDFIVVNLANADMVGHTGKIDKVIIAIECIDKLIKLVLDKINSLSGTLFITADHGNADVMIDDKNEPVTAHTTNLVPFICSNPNIKLKSSGKLANIAPTILDYLGIEIPNEMDQESLIIK